MAAPTRRDLLVIAAGAAMTGATFRTAQGQDKTDAERHGMSAFGDLKYPADFKHFSYVNPDAPKGGLFSQIGPSRQFNQNSATRSVVRRVDLRARRMDVTVPNGLEPE